MSREVLHDQRLRSRIKRGSAGQLKSQAPVQLNPNNQQQEPSRRMLDNQKGFSAVFAFAIVALLSCCSPVSSYFTLPRISRTNDAIIIDYDGLGYGQIANPGFIPVPSFDPYGMLQQQPMLYNGWSFFGRQAATCGRGPAALPKTSITERIGGDSAADPTQKKNAWPFLVVLKKSTDADGFFFCSGSLISDTKVLLAAQCLEKLSVYDISLVTVLVGVASTTEIQMTRRISKVVIHKDYNAVTYANDIAIITMDMPVVLSKTVGTVCLPPASTDPDNYIDQVAALVGWGVANDKDNKPVVTAGLKQGKVTVGANADCKSDADIGKYITDSNTCVTSDKVFTCAADVGGPVAIISSAPNVTPVTWTIVGINSFTKADCTIVGLKLRVSAFRAWIDTYNV